LLPRLAGKGRVWDRGQKGLKKIKNSLQALSFVKNSFYLVSIRTIHLLMIKPILVILFLP
jgi:hypothetical protein